jgi:hypothetical protein
MCTLSFIALGETVAGGAGGVRIVCNRDESRARVAAAAPRWRTIGEGPGRGGRAIWPMDLEGGGTWIAASERGLCLCLLSLNLHPEGAGAPAGAWSRGLVIPRLIGARGLEGAMRGLERMALGRFAPFRLVGIEVGEGGEGGWIAEARWDGERLGIVWHAGPPMCFVSSGLGDSLVLPRLELFEEMVVRGAGPEHRDCRAKRGGTEAQDEFHRHAWPDRPEISVMMSRAAARTVSVTTVEIRSGGVSMAYWPVADGAPVPAGVRAR